MSIQTAAFGTLPSGEQVSLFTLSNANGLRAQITNYGATLVALHIPDRDGKLDDIVLGKDDLQGYLGGHPCFGSTVGRVAGRIGGARFQLDGKIYELAATQPPNCLHGGPEGYDKVLWNATIATIDGLEKLQLTFVDPDGHNGFPGTVKVTVTYALLDDNSLEIDYRASTDKTTPFNITNHSYFNLAGQGKGDVLGHSLQLFASRVGCVDEESTLLGHSAPVRKDYNDYRDPVVLGELPKLDVGNADIHFFLEGGRTHIPKPAAVVREPKSGRIMEVFTTEPGVQFYAALHLSVEQPDYGKDGHLHRPCEALCLETQDYPDSINFPDMGDAILRPNEPFASKTVYRFRTES